VVQTEAAEQVFTDYERLYHKLFNELTDCIEALQAVQQRAEDYFIEHSRPVILPDYLKIVKYKEKALQNEENGNC